MSSIHWATRTHLEPGHLTEFLYDTRLLHQLGLSNVYVVNNDLHKWPARRIYRRRGRYVCRRHHRLLHRDNFHTVTQRLNLIFKQIYRSSQRNRLSIHNGKSEAMLLSTKPLIGPLQELRYEDNSIDFVNSTSFLGVEIDNILSWSPHIDKLCKSYRKKLGALRRMPLLPPQSTRGYLFQNICTGSHLLHFSMGWMHRTDI